MSRFLSLAEAVESTISATATRSRWRASPTSSRSPPGTRSSASAGKRLTLIRMTPDLIYDQLIGMGCADKLVFSWGGNPGVGSLHRLRDAVENGWPQPLDDRGAFPRRHGQRL